MNAVAFEKEVRGDENKSVGVSLETLLKEIRLTEALMENGRREYEKGLRDNTSLSVLCKMGRDQAERAAYLRGLRFCLPE